MQNILRFQDAIFEINTSKGFWEEGQNRDQGEAVALIVSELSEAIEAHRKDKRTVEPLTFEQTARYHGTWDSWFKTRIKDTVEDEIADTVIRILDCCKGWSWPLTQREFRKASTGNFAHDVLRLQNYCIKAFDNEQHFADIKTADTIEPYPGKDWGYVLAAIIKFCEWYDINLEQHIEWKMQFNSTRPYKHNKAY
jgi:NTP pyrophosphatase (non-canonical NTP hydrolase)